MKTYPIMLNMQGRTAVVVGGGPVALRKAHALRRAGAMVRLVAAQLDSDADVDGMTVLREPYQPRCLEGAALALACTNDRAANAAIARDARAAGALVNVADQPDDCDFFLPATAGDGDVTVAVGTGGAAPALAAELKRQLQQALPPRVGEFAAALQQLRAELKAQGGNAARRGRILHRLAGGAMYRIYIAEGLPALRAAMNALASDADT